MDLKTLLPSKIHEVIERAGISTPKQLLLLSVWDIKKLTNLCTDDIKLVKNLVSNYISAPSITCDQLYNQQLGNIATGCVKVDKILNGGFRRGTITEIYGESGSGKTQIAIQTAAHNWSSGTVFICTEEVFPVKRFDQIKKSIADYNTDKDYGQNTFIEHITEASDLISCLRVRLPKLLEKNKLSVVVIDSVAAPFRLEYTNYIQRAEDLRELAVALIKLAQEYKLAIICINQVTACFDGTDDVLPCLGLSWSNMISTRLCLKKTNQIFDIRNLSNSSKVSHSENNIFVRELSIKFAPDLPNSVVNLIITSNGIQSV